jgi:transcriptional regulator with XRE-family HTH domain
MAQAQVNLATVIGLNAKQLRLDAGLTLDQLSRAARGRGLKWTESRVADFEAGRVASPSLNTLLAFVLALCDAGCPNVTLPSLVEFINPMQINESLQLFDADIVNLLRGERADRALNAEAIVVEPLRWKRTTRDRKLANYFDVNISLLGKVTNAQGAAEIRMSKALNIAPSTLAHITAALWKATFSDERDRRAGDGANAQKRGQVSRTMQSELETAIKEALGGNRQ